MSVNNSQTPCVAILKKFILNLKAPHNSPELPKRPALRRRRNLDTPHQNSIRLHCKNNKTLRLTPQRTHAQIHKHSNSTLFNSSPVNEKNNLSLLNMRSITECTKSRNDTHTDQANCTKTDTNTYKTQIKPLPQVKSSSSLFLPTQSQSFHSHRTRKKRSTKPFDTPQQTIKPTDI